MRRAVAMTLDAYAHAVRSNSNPRRPRRHRIEMPGDVAMDDAGRFGALGVLAVLQPRRAAEPGTLMRLERTGKEPRVAFGSGWPLASLDPLAGLREALETAAADAPRRRSSGSATQCCRPERMACRWGWMRTRRRFQAC